MREQSKCWVENKHIFILNRWSPWGDKRRKMQQGPERVSRSSSKVSLLRQLGMDIFNSKCNFGTRRVVYACIVMSVQAFLPSYLPSFFSSLPSFIPSFFLCSLLVIVVTIWNYCVEWGSEYQWLARSFWVDPGSGLHDRTQVQLYSTAGPND